MGCCCSLRMVGCVLPLRCRGHYGLCCLQAPLQLGAEAWHGQWRQAAQQLQRQRQPWQLLALLQRQWRHRQPWQLLALLQRQWQLLALLHQLPRLIGSSIWLLLLAVGALQVITSEQGIESVAIEMAEWRMGHRLGQGEGEGHEGAVVPRLAAAGGTQAQPASPVQHIAGMPSNKFKPPPQRAWRRRGGGTSSSLSSPASASVLCFCWRYMQE